MAITVKPAELDRIIRYMKAEDIVEDNPQERELIEGLALAAKIYLRNAGVEEPEEDNALYDLAVNAYTLAYYDHRDAVGQDVPALRPIVNQTKMAADVERAAAAYLASLET